jgi:hypothetical protein
MEYILGNVHKTFGDRISVFVAFGAPQWRSGTSPGPPRKGLPKKNFKFDYEWTRNGRGKGKGRVESKEREESGKRGEGRGKRGEGRREKGEGRGERGEEGDRGESLPAKSTL